MADPLSDVQNAIWTVLNASSAFVALVPATMQTNLSGEGTRMAIRGFPKEANAPTVRIQPVGGNAHPQMDSSSDSLTQAWLIQVDSKDDRTTEGTTGLLPTKWAIYRALSRQMVTGSTIRSLSFGGNTYVIDCRLMEHEENYRGDGKPPGTWTTVWRFEVDMRFSSTSLAPS